MIVTTKDQELQELHEQWERLSTNQKQEVIDFIRHLTTPQPQLQPQRGVGSNLLKYAGTISKEDLEIMERVIEEECERVDLAEW